MHGRVVIIIVVGLQTLTESHRDYDPAVPTITNGREWKHSYFMKGCGHRNISIVGDEFVLDGRPLRIVSGSVHYFQMPAAYWRDRLRKLKAVGANCVSTYVEWRYHELEERHYSFEGDSNVTQFLTMAAEEGLFVLLRPGPYIDSERDLGGIPYWLHGKYPNIQLRTKDKDFVYETRRWMAKLFKELSPLLYGNGGPIVLVQVENEYGSIGSDKVYKELMRDILLENIQNNAILYTTDGSSPGYYVNGAINGTLTTIDFGPDSDESVAHKYKQLRQFMPHGPLMNSEYYSGWLTHWGDSHMAKWDKSEIVKTLRYMLNHNINFNIYVFFGGTHFGFDVGAYDDNNEHIYQPVVTSYDYDAPLTEAGDPTPKYEAIRNTLKLYFPEINNIPSPKPSLKLEYGKVTMKPCVSLLSSKGRSTLGKKYSDVVGSALPTFERLRQNAGLMLYETTLTESDAVLSITKPRDRIYVHVDQILVGIIDRGRRTFNLTLKTAPHSRLSLVVENQGRICSHNSMRHELKGILSPVTYNNEVLNGTWSVTGYPLKPVDATCVAAPYRQILKQGPTLFVADFTLSQGQENKDTYFYPTGWGKGYVWVNGHNLGRYWPGKGPQVTLYVPGCWLHAAPRPNRLHVLELENAPRNLTVELIDHPIMH